MSLRMMCRLGQLRIWKKIGVASMDKSCLASILTEKAGAIKWH